MACVSHLETRMWKIDLFSESTRFLNLKDIEVCYNQPPIRKWNNMFQSASMTSGPKTCTLQPYQTWHDSKYPTNQSQSRQASFFQKTSLRQRDACLWRSSLSAAQRSADRVAGSSACGAGAHGGVQCPLMQVASGH